MQERSSNEFEPQDDTDEKNENGNDGTGDNTLLVHPEVIAICQDYVLRYQISVGTYLRIIFLRVPDARSIEVSAR